MRLLTPTENHRVNELAGFLGLTLAVLAVLALLSYSPRDASLNVAARPPQDHPALNWIGPVGAYGAGLADIRIVSTLCPGGKERMRRLMNVLGSGRADLRPLVTHRFTLDQIEEAYDLFANQRDGVLKVAITPQ